MHSVKVSNILKTSYYSIHISYKTNRALVKFKYIYISTGQGTLGKTMSKILNPSQGKPKGSVLNLIYLSLNWILKWFMWYNLKLNSPTFGKFADVIRLWFLGLTGLD